METDTLFWLSKQAVKVRADIEVSCYTYEGIDAIKAALRAGLECSTEQIPLNIQLIAPPLYVVTTSTTEHKVGQLRGFKRIGSQSSLRINVFTQIFDPYKTVIQVRIWLKPSFDQTNYLTTLAQISITTRNTDDLIVPQIAIEKLREALDAIQKNIEAAGGLFAVKEAPKVVSDIDEVALQDEMRRLELQNAEVSKEISFRQLPSIWQFFCPPVNHMICAA